LSWSFNTAPESGLIKSGSGRYLIRTCSRYGMALPQMQVFGTYWSSSWVIAARPAGFPVFFPDADSGFLILEGRFQPDPGSRQLVEVDQPIFRRVSGKGVVFDQQVAVQVDIVGQGGNLAGRADPAG